MCTCIGVSLAWCCCREEEVLPEVQKQLNSMYCKVMLCKLNILESKMFRTGEEPNTFSKLEKLFKGMYHEFHNIFVYIFLLPCNRFNLRDFVQLASSAPAASGAAERHVCRTGLRACGLNT